MRGGGRGADKPPTIGSSWWQFDVVLRRQCNQGKRVQVGTTIKSKAREITEEEGELLLVGGFCGAAGIEGLEEGLTMSEGQMVHAAPPLRGGLFLERPYTELFLYDR